MKKDERPEVNDYVKLMMKGSLIEIYETERKGENYIQDLRIYIYYHGLIENMPEELGFLKVNFAFTMEQAPGLFIAV